MSKATRTAPAKKKEETATRTKKKFFVVQVATLNRENKKEVTVSYPETNSNDKALKIAIAEGSEFGTIIGAQITGTFDNAKDLIKSMQKQPS